MIRLGVNIDHVATLRQARGTRYPDIAEAAALAEAAGAQGITIHLREDRRHIQDADVFTLRRTLKTRMNLEMANNPGVVAVALKARPDEACLVPERRRELTTEGGLDAAGQIETLRPTVLALRDAGVCVSLFIAPDAEQVDAAAELGVPYVELHTGVYANAPDAAARGRELDRLAAAADRAGGLGIKVNAGHGLDYENVGAVLRLPHLDTLNIGHSIICRAVFTGLKRAVGEMLGLLNG